MALLLGVDMASEPRLLCAGAGPLRSRPPQLTVAGVNVPSPTVHTASNAGRRPAGSVGRAMNSLHAGLAGLDRVGRDSRLRLLVLLAGAQCFVRGCLNVLLVVAAFDLFHAGSSGVGYLNAALGVGGLCGVNMTAAAIGSIVALVVESACGARTALLIVGLILPGLALASGRSLRGIDTTLRPSEGLELVETIPMFAPLSMAAKERVAASLSPVTVPAGETVVSVGEPGHTF